MLYQNYQKPCIAKYGSIRYGILDALSKNEGLSVSEIANQSGLDCDYSFRTTLWELCSKGLIHHVGRKNRYQYFITGAGSRYLAEYTKVSKFKELVKEVALL